jgi:hypothetical protein
VPLNRLFSGYDHQAHRRALSNFIDFGPKAA